jgi:hypothetical protein
MRVSPLAVERIEFLNVRVKANQDWVGGDDSPLPQLVFDLNDGLVEWKSDLQYPDDESDDPKHFAFRFAVRVIQSKQPKGVSIPYDVEVEALVFLFAPFDANVSQKERFKIARENGYPILYGAIREMVSNLTARGTHGLWQIPSANFQDQIKPEVDQDEKARIERKLAPAPSTKKTGSKNRPGRKAN